MAVALQLQMRAELLIWTLDTRKCLKYSVNLEGVTCGRICSAITDSGARGQRHFSQPKVFYIDARGPKGNEAYRAAHTGSADSSLWPKSLYATNSFNLRSGNYVWLMKI